MITLTFEPTNPEQAALLGEFLPQYMRAGVLQVSGEPEQIKQTVEAAAVEEEKPAPKRGRKPAATPAAPETAPVAAAQPEAAADFPSEPPPPPPPPPAVTLEQVRAKLASLSQAGKASEVKGLITKYGAAKLTDIPADKYAELLAAAQEI